MAISNNASYIPTMNLFLAHWASVNTALGVPLVVVKEDGISSDRTGFLNVRDALQGNNATVIDKLNDVQITRGDIENLKAPLLARLNEFTGLLDAYWAATGFINARPKAPNMSDGQERFLAPMHDMASLWLKLDAAPAPGGVTLPLTLSDGTVQADIAAQIGVLQTKCALLATCEQAVTLARADRDNNKLAAYEVMKAYRKAVPPKCRQQPALVETLPRLTPEDGHTPEPVNASAVFEAPDKSKVAYDASDDAALERYELRGNPGTEYDDDDAVVIDTNLPADPREFLTNFALTLPGAQVALKVYVVLDTDNEAGSATMVVTRPV